MSPEIPRPPGWVGWGVTTWINFLGSSWNLPNFWNVDPKNSQPQCGVGVKNNYRFAGQLIRDISRTLDFLPPKIPPWTQLFGSNNSQINPHMSAKLGRNPTVVSKGGGGTDIHRPYTIEGTLQLYIVDASNRINYPHQYSSIITATTNIYLHCIQ